MHKEKTTNVRVPLSLWEAVREEAQITRRSASTELAIIIEEALAARKVARDPPVKNRKTKP